MDQALDDHDADISAWAYNLATAQFSAAGIYSVVPVAGDTTYFIDTSQSCTGRFERLE
jgi:hypothetical protein